MSETNREIPFITVIGLGAGDLDQMPLGIYRTLQQANPLYLRTASHPVVQELEREGITFSTFDAIYEEEEDFSAVYEKITRTLLTEANRLSHIYYAVPGHPLTAEITVQQLIESEEKGDLRLEIKGGQSFLDPMFTALRIDPNDGFQLLDATSMQPNDLMLRQHVIVSQVYDAMIASDVKLTLMEKYPDDYEVTLVTAAGTKEETLKKMPLFELDREAYVNNLTALYIPPVTEVASLYREFATLRHVIATLRGPDGCPWDKKQTHESLKKYLIEETYEVIDAIDEKDDEHLIEELGDVLLQVLLHAQIGEDEGYFTMEDVIETLTAKMIRRHPHVFGDQEADTAEDVTNNWEAIKKKEKGSQGESLLHPISPSLPALIQAYELQKTAAKVGFDWNDDAPMWKKFHEELAEWLTELKNGDQKSIKKEFGDLLFVIVNLGRFYKLQPEECLHMTNRKFKDRFRYIEKALQERGKIPEETSLADMDHFWEEAKQQERRNQ
ncbi:bifunctional methyltransferase/pyrophosphohydrolase YabN [Alteribacillus iranensis]|uniref:Tetrapyrrole methylase family protein / MazG family protein n=1 Tax=Alteribacillus iranensis TaxID=930128 RepID=A0A1I2FEA8_9BACI|nr:nucleoside triphosphate pyrophosphohydrolase [Alteribacillus iranensis]SFF03585.1 tetrapyrrole methylase family protein / MazG family protein [Alteribacillus iranensis]